jgi:hypothetical protein
VTATSIRLATDHDGASRTASRPPEASSVLPLGACLLIWFALAAAGWGLVGLVLHFT